MSYTNASFAVCAPDEGHLIALEACVRDDALETERMRGNPGSGFLIRISCHVKGISTHVSEPWRTKLEQSKGLKRQELVTMPYVEQCFINHSIRDETDE